MYLDTGSHVSGRKIFDIGNSDVPEFIILDVKTYELSMCLYRPEGHIVHVARIVILGEFCDGSSLLPLNV